MIQENFTEVQQPRWQKILAEGVSSIDELVTILELDATLLAISNAASQQFPLRVPRGFVARMKKGDINDPLLRQILPLQDEIDSHPLYSVDPLQELAANPLPGLLHKYVGRVLITLTGICPINCRYCFRRHFPYLENKPVKENWQQILDYISSDASISEVILSGGEPLLLNDQQLEQRIAQLAMIPHLHTLRFHTRIPIVLPQRITPEFVANLANSRLQIVMVTHCNHPQEIDQSVEQGIKLLRDHQIMLLNQAVLLKGVNDSVETLVSLSHVLFRLGILPYYLHYPDKVQGTHHFTPDITHAQQLMRQVSERLPGYLVPKLVYEQSGAKSKLVIPY